MKKLLINVRFYVLTANIAFSIVLYLWVIATVSLGLSRIAILVEDYGVVSLFFLYLSLLAGPFCYTFRFVPYRNLYLRARRALGVSAWYFALLHGGFSFFGQLGGFAGLGFLDNNYLLALILGFLAFFIFTLLAITSFDYAVRKLSFPKWKFLHRFVYLASVLVLIHTVMLGTHYAALTGIVSQITFIALAFLLLLEAPRIDKILKQVLFIPQFGLSTLIIAIISSVIYFTLINPLVLNGGGGISFDIHAAHRQLAQLALSQQTQQTIGTIPINSIPGLNGDRNKRYTVSMSTDPADPAPNEDVTLHFKVYDASNGAPVTLFHVLYAWPMHLMIVDSALSYFDHTHPDQQGTEFVHTTQFPKSGLYHIYIQFQPFGGIEQQMAFTLPVGTTISEKGEQATQPVDKNLTKTFDDYKVTMDTHGTLEADLMSIGQQTISFTIKDAKTGRPITMLKPFMGAFGHLTMINEKTYDFIHVHPYAVVTPPPNANGGPTVDFLPIGIYGPFKPGIYRAFGEFSTKAGTDFDTDFTVKIE